MNLVSKTFKSGNSVALRLPRALGIAADVAMRIEQEGNALVVRPVADAAEGRARLARLVAALEAIGPVGEIERRAPPEPPARPGL